jgi:PAS domain S-box-containing protein
MTIDPSAEIQSLRATVTDLLALSTIPEAWVGREPPAIAADLADLLVGSLKLDFAFVRLSDPTGGQVVELTRGDSWKAFPEWLQQHLAEFGQISRKEILSNVGAVKESCRGLVIPIGVNSERGLVAAASDRLDFPNLIDQQLLSVAANNAATAFQNAFLIKALRSAQEALLANEQALRKARDELEIKVAERTAELRHSERELRDLLDSIPAVAWTALPDGSNSYVNRRFAEYCGMPPERVAGSGWHAATHPEDLERHNTKWLACVASGEPFEDEVRFRRADGEYRWHLQRGVPLRDEAGNIVKWYGVLTDIEDRKRVEETLRRSEAYLAEAQRLSHTGSFGWKPDAGEIVWSDETYRIFEYDRSIKPTIDSVVQSVHPEDRADVQEVINRAFAGAPEFEHAFRLLLPDGRVKNVQAIAHVLQDASGNREYVGAVTDITERETAEEALRSSEAYLAEAQRLSKTGSFAWSPTADTTYFSEECYRVLGFEPQGASPPRFETIMQRIYPDDQGRCREVVEESIRDKVDLELDYRIVHPDKRVRDVHCVGHVVLDRSGELLEIVGTVIDFTERKRAEEELRRSEMELRQMLDLAPQLVAVYGPNRERLHINRIALDYLGLSLEEWRETSERVAFVHPDDRARERDYFDRALSAGSAYELELRLRKGDGTYRWFLARSNPLRDDKGNIRRWYVVNTDIDDRKRTEERLKEENIALREEIDRASMFEEIVGTSPALQTVLSRISKVAPTDSTVLITGETGTGKELVARAIHRRSSRASRAFVSVNCAAIPRDLIASELFGHEKGAFTGAMQRRLGRFELAEGGTIFLDEVGELLPDTQVALLRVLQEREFERVGGRQPIHVDVRVIAATNRDLKRAVASGNFREDLYYRLNVFPLEVPPLRARRADIPLLVEYFIDRYGRKTGKNIRSVDKKTLQLLQSYLWPGNIRELQNIIERSVIVCETEIFTVDESWLSQQSHDERSGGKLYLSQKLEAKEKEVIEEALRESQGRVFGPSGAAAKLGIARSTLESKIQSLNINKNRFKAKPRS